MTEREGWLMAPVHVGKKEMKGYPIIETATGKIKGHSKTKKDAEISTSIRNREHAKKIRGK